MAGLTTAYLLSQESLSTNITIVAKHFPGDYDIGYASPWAGANYAPWVSMRIVESSHDHDADGSLCVE